MSTSIKALGGGEGGQDGVSLWRFTESPKEYAQPPQLTVGFLIPPNEGGGERQEMN